MDNKQPSYKCDECGGVFTPYDDWTEEKRIAELERDHSGVSVEECAVVCEDCWKAMGGGQFHQAERN
jgi:hypothetical protein